MGNSQHSFNQSFLNDWVQLQRQGVSQLDKNIWAKKNDRSIQMQEYALNVTSQQQLQEEQRVHQLRRNHPQLVSTLHFKDETEEQFCASNYKGKIYIERIPLTLQTITDIPFPDALHIYSQSLQGFHALTNQVESGWFPISEQHIGINCQSICKVWMNSKFNRNYPSRNERIMEQRMVKIILDTIEENVDLGTLDGKPTPMTYIYTKAKTPSQVRFGQAINLLRSYVNEYFGGIIPERVSCVDKVGGAFLLSKNWQGSRSQNRQVVQRQQQINQQNYQTPQLMNTNQFYDSTPIDARTIRQNVGQVPQNENNYTAFRRQEPMSKPLSTLDPHQGSFYRNDRIDSTINTPNFKSLVVQSSQANFQRPIIQQRPPVQIINAPVNRVIPKFVQVNPNPSKVPVYNEVRRSQIVTQVTNQGPLTGSKVNFVSPRTEVRQNLIQKRIQQVTSQKGIIIQPLSQPTSQPVLKSPIVIQPSGFANIQQRAIFVGQKQPIINFQEQQRPVNIAQSQAEVIKQQQGPQIPQRQVVQNVRKSTIIFVNSGQVSEVAVSQPSHPISQPFQQVFQTRTPQVQQQSPIPTSIIKNEQLQKVNSKLIFIERGSPSRPKATEQTIPVNPNQTMSPQSNEYSSYYAFTSKLYDREDIDKEVPISSRLNSDNFNVSNNNNATVQQQNIYSPSKNKYKVSLDDGMSSAAFLNQLKNMSLGSSSFKKTQNNYDFMSSYQPSSYLSKFDNDFSSKYDFKSTKPLNLAVDTQQPAKTYKVDYENYTTTLTDGRNHQNDLIIVSQKMDMVPLKVNKQNDGQDINLNNRLNFQQQQNQYKVSYQHQQGETPSGNVHYQTQIVKVQNQNGIYQQQYYSSTHYQSTFNKYASYNPNQNNLTNTFVLQSDRRPVQNHILGENIETQYTINNIEDPQPQYDPYRYNTNVEYQQTDFNRQYAPQDAHEEQYKVDFDPQILADLQRLKGTN